MAGEITPTTDIDLFAQQLTNWNVVSPLIDAPVTTITLDLLWSMHRMIFKQHPSWSWKDTITQSTFSTLSLYRMLMLVEKQYGLPIFDVPQFDVVVRGRGLYWTATHSDTPSVGEVLHETINDLAGYLSGRFNVPPWAQMENLEEQAVQEIHQLWNALREYNLLPSE